VTINGSKAAIWAAITNYDWSQKLDHVRGKDPVESGRRMWRDQWRKSDNAGARNSSFGSR